MSVQSATIPPLTTPPPPSVTQQQPQQPSSNEQGIDLDAIPGQIGHAILHSSDGSIIQSPTGSISERDVSIVYRILLEIGTVLDGKEGLQRLAISFKSVSYAITLGGSDGYVYIVKKRSSSS